MRRLIALAQATLLILLLFCAWYGLTLLLEPEPQAIGGLALLVALVGFGGLALWVARSVPVGLIQLDMLLSRLAPHGAGPLRWLILPIGILLAGLAYRIAPEQYAQPWLVLGCWAAGALLMLAGARLIDRPLDQAGMLESISPARWEIPVLTALTVVALLARALMIDRLPSTLHGDEGEMGLIARSILAGELRNPFETAWLGHPTLWFFLQALALQLFGDTIGGLRLVSALLGTAAIPACYLFARPLYGRSIALAGAILLAGYHLHLHYSRIALNNIGDPLMALLAFACYFHAWRTGRQSSFVAAGLCLGLAQHFYTGARLTPLILLAVLIHQLISDRRRFRARLPGLALMGLGGLAGVGPLARFFLSDSAALMARLDAQGYIQTGRLAEDLAQGHSLVALIGAQAWKSFGGYVVIPDISPFYGPEVPLLDQTAAVLFLCGVSMAIWRIRRVEWFLLLAWVIGAAVFGGMLLVDPPQSPRYVIAAPAICLLVILGAAQILGLMRDLLGLPARLTAAAIVLSAALLSASSTQFYFNHYTPRLRYGASRELSGIGAFLSERDTDEYTFFLGAPYAFFNHGIIAFTAPLADGEDVIEPITSADQVPRPPVGQRPLFIAWGPREPELEIVQQRYPGGRILRFTDPFDSRVTLFVVYETR